MSSLTKRRRVYYIRWRENGKYQWVSIDLKSFSKADDFWSEWKEQRRLGISIFNLNHTLQELFDKRIKNIDLHCKPKTVLIYKNTFRHFSDYLGNRPLAKIIPEDFEDYVKSRIGKVSKVSINIDIRCMQATFQYACSRKVRMLKENAFREIQQFEIDEEKEVYIPDQHFERIIAEVQNPVFKNFIMHAYLPGCAWMRSLSCGIKMWTWMRK